MKNIKVLGILLVLAIVAATVIMRNNTATETSPITKSNTINIPFSTKPLNNASETKRVAAVEIVYPRQGNDENTRVAIVDIVYPRLNGEQGEICNEGAEFEFASFKEVTQFCDMSETQINKLITVKYKKEVFCACITKFCGEQIQPRKFVECLN